MSDISAMTLSPLNELLRDFRETFQELSESFLVPVEIRERCEKMITAIDGALSQTGGRLLS